MERAIMNKLTIEINVNVSLSEKTQGFLRQVLAAQCGFVPKGLVADLPEVQQMANLEGVQAETPAKTPTETPTETPAADAPKYDAAYCRQVMNRTFSRLLGEDWENDKKSDRYKQVRDEFKFFASQASKNRTAKPSELNPDEMKLFEAACGELYFSEDGKLLTQVPF